MAGRSKQEANVVVKKVSRVKTRGNIPKTATTVRTKHVFASSLSSAQRAKLRGHAHPLKPVVLVGGDGLTRNVLNEIKAALETHELVKIQLPPASSAEDKKDAVEELRLLMPANSHVVARLGRVVILYLEKKPSDAKLPLRSL